MMPHCPLGPICVAASVHFAAAVANFSLIVIDVETFRSPPP
jgi:galactonate dehydratase